MVQGVGGANGGGGRDKDRMAPIVGKGGTEVEGSLAVMGPRCPFDGGIMDHDELTSEKSRGKPLRPCHAEMVGSREKPRMWLRVSSVRGKSKCQRSGGKVTWAEAKTEMKWFFAVRMARSAGLVLWFWGGTGWKKMRGDC